MKILRWLACTALALPVVIGAQQVGAQTVGSDTGTSIPCTSLTFSKAFLAKNPKAPAACIEARDYHGKKYARFDGKVYIKQGDSMTIQFHNVSGDVLTAITVKPSAQTMSLLINGKETKFADLKVGDPISVWLAEDRWDFYDAPGHAAGKVVSPAK